MEGILKVTPAVLRSKSSEFDQNRSQVRSLIEQLSSQVTSLNSSWQGEAAMAYQNAYAGLRDDIERVDRMIGEHVRDLNEMADLYQAADDKVRNESEVLPKDAIK